MSYVLERNQKVYERLRRQSAMWEPTTARLLDRVALAPGATCLDVGCSSGDAMRLMAERVGPAGQVTGVDIDADAGAHAVERLHRAIASACGR
jgi:ubiquinone/menaquinone biosynthesis C-methylase UbiE